MSLSCAGPSSQVPTQTSLLTVFGRSTFWVNINSHALQQPRRRARVHTDVRSAHGRRRRTRRAHSSSCSRQCEISREGCCQHTEETYHTCPASAAVPGVFSGAAADARAAVAVQGAARRPRRVSGKLPAAAQPKKGSSPAAT